MNVELMSPLALDFNINPGSTGVTSWLKKLFPFVVGESTTFIILQVLILIKTLRFLCIIRFCISLRFNAQHYLTFLSCLVKEGLFLHFAKEQNNTTNYSYMQLCVKKLRKKKTVIGASVLKIKALVSA